MFFTNVSPYKYLTEAQFDYLKHLVTGYGTLPTNFAQRTAFAKIAQQIDALIYQNRCEVTNLNDAALLQKLNNAEARCVELASDLARYKSIPPIDTRFVPPERYHHTPGQTVSEALTQIQKDSELTQAYAKASSQSSSSLTSFTTYLTYSDGSVGHGTVDAVDIFAAERKLTNMLVCHLQQGVTVVRAYTRKTPK